MCILDCLLVLAIIFYMYKAKIWMGGVTSLHSNSQWLYCINPQNMWKWHICLEFAVVTQKTKREVCHPTRLIARLGCLTPWLTPKLKHSGVRLRKLSLKVSSDQDSSLENHNPDSNWPWQVVPRERWAPHCGCLSVHHADSPRAASRPVYLATSGPVTSTRSNSR